MNKKSQMEIMGLVVIVIIIAVAFLFFVYFMRAGGEREEPKAIYQKELLAYNTIGAILQSTTACKGLTFADLIEDCVAPFEEKIDCGGGYDSCDWVENDVTFILDKFFFPRQQEYFFYVMVMKNDEPDFKLEVARGDCLANRVSATQPLPSRYGDFVVGLDICD